VLGSFLGEVGFNLLGEWKGGSLQQPGDVMAFSWRNGDAGLGGVGSGRLECAAIAPFVDFCMTIEVGKARGTRVAGCRQVEPDIRARRVELKTAVVDAVFMLVDE
jgi:hypothetical protein